MNEKVIIFDFGSQYTQLIARRVREQNVFCEIVPFNKTEVLDDTVKAVILSGSPFSVRDENALDFNLEQVKGKYPVLAVCYGAQLIASKLGGVVHQSKKREYGKAALELVIEDDALFDGVGTGSQIWMSHSDSVLQVPDHFEVVASTEDIPVAAFRSNGQLAQPIYCIQFHPEVTHSLDGAHILRNFLVNIAGCSPTWTPESFVNESIESIRNKVGDDEVLMAISGGVDSSVAATLIQRAIGDRLHCCFVDNGLLRKNEYQDVLDTYHRIGLNVTGIDAKREFYENLKGVSDPERKRKIIGGKFIDIFDHFAKELPEVKWLGQGTIYPDVIESVSVVGPSVTIKSHHNVGGLPEKMHLKVVEPLNMLFKDEVRTVGRALGLPDFIIDRHPFPGPGLGIRILGDVTEEKVSLLQEADDIYINNLRKFDLYDKVWQAVTVLLPVKSVGVMGDERTYEWTVVIRAVNSSDGMTAEWSRLPHDFLAKVSSEIINNVKGINRVVYDISTKPPATIEWE
ncbi:MAG: glutamine-hydrolyzing GMP synthase [Bacteroidia bacterium]|nr:glutamine-hydrolyzing GMP synthase [Bacteroidia bacterium]